MQYLILEVSVKQSSKQCCQEQAQGIVVTMGYGFLEEYMYSTNNYLGSPMCESRTIDNVM